jgi:predicted esterase
MLIDQSFTAEIRLYYDAFIPDDLSAPAPLMIAVHGYGAHKRHMMREARSVAPKGFVIASIQGPHQHFRPTADGYRVGFGWLTDHRPEESVAVHHDFVTKLVEKLGNDRIVDRKKVYLFGFSQACALNFRFALTYPDAVRGIIGVCGGIPGDLETNPLFEPSNADALYIYNTEDEFYPLEKYESYASRLAPYFPDLSTRVFESKHEITEAMRTDIRAWLARGNPDPA